MKQEDINIAIQQIKKGDAKAFEKIYDAYSASLFGICLKIVKEDEACEDILQDAFVKIWKNIETYNQSKGRLYTWMLNITRNIFYSYLSFFNFYSQNYVFFCCT